ncbi:MAG: VTT domain-containing protein, partial [Actinomycetota bacterium]|nr:VTT domain-containing protein [Actinomycetota bacterium]
VAALYARRTGRITRAQLIVAFVVLAGAAVYGSGLIEPPDVEAIIMEVGRALGQWTYLVVGLGAFLETGAFVGLLAPGESLIIFGGVVAGQGVIDVYLLLGLVWTAVVAGDSVSYLLGRRLGRGFILRHGPKVKITAERLEQVEGFFERHGGKTLLVGRFIGLVRAVAPFLAGASRLSFPRFFPYAVVGGGLYATFFVVLGYVFWRSFDEVTNLVGQGAFGLGVAAAVALGAVLLYRALSDRERRAALRARIDRAAQRPPLRQLLRVVAPVYRGAIVPAARRAAGPARFAWQRLTPGDLGLELTTLVALVAAGGYAFAALLVVLSGQPYAPLDLRALAMADELRLGVTTELARIATHAGAGVVVGPAIALTAVILLVRRHIAEAAVLLSGALLTSAAVHVTKAALDRRRPELPLIETEFMSYPSGHAAYAVGWIAIAVALSRAIPWVGGRVAVVVAAVVLTVVVGLTRVQLRAHYLSDVVGGWGLALSLFALCAIVALVVGHIRDTK